MLTRSAAPILLCFFLFGSSLQAPRLIPVTEDCPNKCFCTISDGMMEVDCVTDDQFRAIEKPSPEEDLTVHDEIELVKPISNSDTAPEETASDGPQALNASVEEDEKSKQQNVSETRIVIESAIAVDIDEKSNEIDSEKLPLDEEMMQADEHYSVYENQPPSDDGLKEGEKEFPETLVSDPDSKVVAKKGTHLHPIKEEEWQRDQAPEESYEDEEYDDEKEEKHEEKDKQKSGKDDEEKNDEKPKFEEEVEKQELEDNEKPGDVPVSLEEIIDNQMDNETKKEDASENDKEIGVSIEESEVTTIIPVEQSIETKDETPTKIETKNQPMEDENQASHSEEEEELTMDTVNEDNNNKSNDETVVIATDIIEESGNKQSVEEEGDAYDKKENVEPVVIAEDEEIKTSPKDIIEEKIDMEDGESAERDENGLLIEISNKQAEEDKSSSLEHGDGDLEFKNNEDGNTDDTISGKENEEVNKDTKIEATSAEKDDSKEDDTDSDLIQSREADGIPIVPGIISNNFDDEITTPTVQQEGTQEEITETVAVIEENKNQSEIEPPNITSDLNNKTDNEKNVTDVAEHRSRLHTNDKGLDIYSLPDGEILVNETIDDTRTGKIINEQDEENMETTQPQQSTASWVILGLILGTFVVVLGYAAIRGSINKKKEAEITADSKASNSIPPVFDSKFTRKPDFETGTELKELSRPFLQPSEEPVREYKDKKDDLDEVVVNGIDMSTGLPYIDAPNPQQRSNAPPPLDLPAPNDTSRHDSTTTSPSTEPSAPELQQQNSTIPTLVRTRIVDNSPQMPRMISNEHVIDDD